MSVVPGKMDCVRRKIRGKRGKIIASLLLHGTVKVLSSDETIIDQDVALST